MDECVHNNLGDPDFESIFNRHHHRVYILCLNMTGNVAEAEYLTEAIFVQVFRQQQSFPKDAAFSTWLHRLTVNRVLMHFRGNLVRKQQGLRLTEISRAMGRPDRSSKSRLRKALMKLRELRMRAESLRVRAGHGPVPIH
jgi:RNA polymerase sigma-70 factor, ECF subfamily